MYSCVILSTTGSVVSDRISLVCVKLWSSHLRFLWSALLTRGQNRPLSVIPKNHWLILQHILHLNTKTIVFAKIVYRFFTSSFIEQLTPVIKLLVSTLILRIQFKYIFFLKNYSWGGWSVLLLRGSAGWYQFIILCIFILLFL